MPSRRAIAAMGLATLLALSGCPEDGDLSELAIEAIGADGSVRGELRTDAGVVYGFEAAPSEAGGRATFVLPDGERLTVEVQTETGRLDFAGGTFDGAGALGELEATALAEALEALGPALAGIPLELGCRDAGVAEAALAALVFPLQLQLKYLDPDRAMNAYQLARRSSCAYFPAAAASLDAFEAAAPRGRLLLGPEAPFPVVMGWLPLDEEGAAAQSTVVSGLTDAGAPSLIGPCGARCRGACGVDCTTTNCTRTREFRCMGSTAPVRSSSSPATTSARWTCAARDPDRNGPRAALDFRPATPMVATPKWPPFERQAAPTDTTG